MDPLALAGRHAKWVLAAGLVAAIALPGLAEWLNDWLTVLICIIMAIGAMRLAPTDLPTMWADPMRTIGQVLVLQLAMPVIAALVFVALGQSEAVGAKVVVLLLSAPAIVSSPNIAGLMGLNVATAMRLMIWTTLLLPVTCLPALIFLFGGEAMGSVVLSALRLVGVIALAGGVGLFLRRYALPQLGPTGELRLDGLSAVSLGIFVVALMPAIRSGFAEDAGGLALWMALAFAINFGLQAVTYRLSSAPRDVAGAFALVCGNRNLALFFAALPAAQTETFMVFLAAYQIPMYLTPILLSRLYWST